LSRVLIAAEALGTGRAALRRAVAYARERVVFEARLLKIAPIP
jgi:alkylation response protein AidB-like acyl-CoA dehydrogenase